MLGKQVQMKWWERRTPPPLKRCRRCGRVMEYSSAHHYKDYVRKIYCTKECFYDSRVTNFSPKAVRRRQSARKLRRNDVVEGKPAPQLSPEDQKRVIEILKEKRVTDSYFLWFTMKFGVDKPVPRVGIHSFM